MIFKDFRDCWKSELVWRVEKVETRLFARKPEVLIPMLAFIYAVKNSLIETTNEYFDF